MRIGYVVLRFPSLTETFVADEIHALRAMGTEVTILSLLKPRPQKVQRRSRELLRWVRYPGGTLSVGMLFAWLYFLRHRPAVLAGVAWELCRVPRGSGGWGGWLRRLPIFFKSVYFAHQVRKHRVDALHAHFAWLSGAGAWIISELTEIPYSVTVHAYDLFRSNELARQVCTNATRVVAISDYNRQWVERECPGANVVVIHCGVDLSELYRCTKDSDSNGEVFHITAAGSLIEKKGHATLIEACARLRVDGRRFRCTIIGSGPLEDSLRRMIASRGLEDVVELEGAQSHEYVLDKIARSHASVLACVVADNGDRDGIPVALMEAAALERALISTDVSGIPELVRDGINGLVVRPGNPAALARAISQLMDDDQLRRAMGQRGREIVEQEFSLCRTAGRMQEIFREVVGAKSLKDTSVDYSVGI